VTGRVHGHAQVGEELTQALGAGLEVRAKDRLQRRIAVGVDPDRRAHHHGQAERAGDAVRHAVVERDRIGQGVRERGLGIGEGARP